MKKHCYICDKVGTSHEHIPPAVFFPEKKDLPSGFPDLRKNLITVPSCDEHNLEKSGNDFYLFMVVVTYFDNNVIAQNQFTTKAIRSIKRKPKIANIYIRDFYPMIINGNPTIAPKVNVNRLKKTLEFISRGLYFHDFKKKWKCELKITLLSLFASPDRPNFRIMNNEILELRNMVEIFFKKLDKKGENQKIFYYQFYRDEEINKYLLRMVFYEGFEVIASEQ